MSAPFTLVVHGRSGHASLPGIADNALVKAAAADRADRGVSAPQPQLGPETEALLLRLHGRGAGRRRALSTRPAAVDEPPRRWSSRC